MSDLLWGAGGELVCCLVGLLLPAGSWLPSRLRPAAPTPLRHTHQLQSTFISPHYPQGKTQRAKLSTSLAFPARPPAATQAQGKLENCSSNTGFKQGDLGNANMPQSL